MSVKNAFAAARQTHGAARILINCVGTSTTFKDISKGRMEPLEEFSRIMQVNLTGTFDCI